MDPDNEVILSIRPSLGRRLLGTLSLAGLGVVMLPLVFRATGIWPIVFAISSIAVLLAARRLWYATDDYLELTREELRTGSGRVLTRIDNVLGVDRGAFAFKPSNGFLVKLHKPAGSGWQPGLFWQRGRMIGVGGVLPAGQSRAMAELITALNDGTFDALTK
ncbi:MAG: hypothetical protein AAF965_12940 [Pseudomonadota bacterium]